jgi:hypothetical protein
MSTCVDFREAGIERERNVPLNLLASAIEHPGFPLPKTSPASPGRGHRPSQASTKKPTRNPHWSRLPSASSIIGMRIGEAKAKHLAKGRTRLRAVLQGDPKITRHLLPGASTGSIKRFQPQVLALLDTLVCVRNSAHMCTLIRRYAIPFCSWKHMNMAELYRKYG